MEHLGQTAPAYVSVPGQPQVTLSPGQQVCLWVLFNCTEVGFIVLMGLTPVAALEAVRLEVGSNFLQAFIGALTLTCCTCRKKQSCQPAMAAADLHCPAVIAF